MLTFEQLCELQDNWDGEGAPKPSQQSIVKAREIINWIEDCKVVNDHTLLDIDADVLGGVSLTLINNKKNKKVWISVLNDYKKVAVVFTRTNTNHFGKKTIRPRSSNLNYDNIKNRILLFIKD